MKKELTVTALGGGTGLAQLLRGLKAHTRHLNGIVAVTDDGGSSGALRREIGVLPPGDIRNCLVALSEEENLMSRLFQYRFPAAGTLAGHSFGNLFITAMSAITGSFDKGISSSSQVLAVRGKVLPVTLYSVSLEAHMVNGEIVRGETNISRSEQRVKRLTMYPRIPPAAPEVVETILNSDVIVLGPGSLYTSVIATMLVRGVSEALKKTKAPIIYVANVMTQPNETRGYTLFDHLNALYTHFSGLSIDYCVVNAGKIPARIAARYAREGSFPVIIDRKKITQTTMVSADVVSKKAYAHHDPHKLAQCILDIAVRH